MTFLAHRSRNWIFAATVSVSLLATPAIAIETKAREAYLVDFNTGAILLDHNSEQLMPPASMTKIMAVYLAFDRLKDGRLKLEDEIPISEKAWRKGGSK
ncbi:MAG: D-alanyl-D-alanine carboxypeptidase, partial [Rhodospirillaceae bacterium]|nr:D-alanyl-D-alanine carboxypeptidase [Rhodospirillaceae bacterium]